MKKCKSFSVDFFNNTFVVINYILCYLSLIFESIVKCYLYVMAIELTVTVLKLI